MHAGAALRFSDGARLDGLALAGLAVLLYGGLYAWTRLGKVYENDGLIVLALGIGGAVGLLYAGSWTAVVVDPVTRRVESRIGFLRWSAPIAVPFDQVRAVVVERSVERDEEVSPSTQQGGRSSVNVTRHVRYDLRIVHAGGAILVPFGNHAQPADLEPVAGSIAALGGWPALRRGYDLAPGAGGLQIAPRREDAEVLIEAPR